METETENPTNNTILHLIFRHHLWANLRLFKACQSLSDAQLNQSAPGTYGSIQATIAHIVRAEERYLYFLNGYNRGNNDIATEETPLGELIERAKQSGQSLQQVAANTPADSAVLIEDEEELLELPANVVLLQALHHGSEHRTHITTIMGQLGIEPPSISGWAYNDIVLAKHS